MYVGFERKVHPVGVSTTTKFLEGLFGICIWLFAQRNRSALLCELASKAARELTGRTLTVNIQTHLWGAVFFAFLLIVTLCKTIHSHPTVTWHDAAGFVVFLLAAITCLSFSAVFHTANCHSVQVAKECVMFDYAGIL
ncbi:hypothetical protein FS837_007696, partial [Tulasnella sp. UAMH 9824]